jgi:hypothetical protein
MARGRKEDREMVKATVRVFQDDLVYLRKAYPHSGYNGILRALAARHVRQLRIKTAEHLQDVRLTDEELQSV